LAEPPNRTMSSALTNLVPILDGSNYQQWAPPMRNFLKSQGQWLILKEDNPADWYLAPVEELPFSTTADDDADEEATATETKARAKAKASSSASAVPKPTDDQKKEMTEWAETNSKAVGNISLRLHHSIQYKYQDEDNAGKLWKALESEYGNPGVSATYLKFKAALAVRIPVDSDPTLAIDEFTSYFGRMAEAGVVIERHIQAMVLMSKLPREMDSLAQIVCQVGSVKELDFDKLRRSIILSWEQRNNRGPPRNQQQAKKISAVQRGPNEPTFQQQQQQGGSGRGGARRGRGRRGNGKRQQQGPQVQSVDGQQAQTPPQQQAGPSTTPAPPQQQQFQSAFGGIASPTYFPRSTGFYTSFNKALDISHQIGVPASTENLKRLELHQRIKDPRPLKQRKPSPDVDEVSLYSVDAFMDDSADATTGNTQRYAGAGKANMPLTMALHLDSKQEQPLHTVDKIPTWTKRLYTESSSTNILPCFPSMSETDKTLWMLDSGASRHFTYDINDFVVYEAIPEHIEVLTATTTTKIVGMGTVIIKTERGAHRISPVWYIPELTTRLLSLGQFLQS
jgi:hypothetical protein